jgi:nitrogen-specific signal transduction histidine kinase/CheY-like chemotaxis protein
MRSLLLVADKRERLTHLQELLGDAYTLFTAESQGDALEWLQLTKVDVVLGAFETRSLTTVQFFERAKVLQPQCVTLYLAPDLPPDEVGDERYAPQTDFCIHRPFSRDNLRSTVQQAFEKQQLLEGLASHREQGSAQRASLPPKPTGELSIARIGQLLRDFAKAFSVNFDLNRALNLFLDAVGELLRPSRLSILVPNRTSRDFEVRAYRGLQPRVAESLRLRADEGLPLWLMTEARIIHRAEVEGHLHIPPYLEIHREMQALRSVASIPLIAAGALVGILNLGERITGLQYTDDELEILFSLASQVAIGIQDINLYHALQYQKVFIENILTSMSSGVVSIGMDERIRLVNHRAAEILQKSPAEMLDEDLRHIPSPLGDLLYETLRHGVTYHKCEVSAAAGKRPLEVSTYQIFDEQRRVAGSVMVFEDLTAQKQLDEERCRADRLDFLNRIVGHIAHEIKNPLVSIKTFVELIDDQYDDPEFRRHFSNVVRRDVGALDNIAGKLIDFSRKITYRFEYGCVNASIENCISSIIFNDQHTINYYLLDHNGSQDFKPTHCNIDRVYAENLPMVKFDEEQFEKALLYILVYLMGNMKSTGKIVAASDIGQSKHHDKSICITITGIDCRPPETELRQLFEPFNVEESSLIDVGPCIARKIIEEHGGRLKVRQSKDDQTTFVISLPVSR